LFDLPLCVIEFEELAHLVQPPFLHKADVVGVLVVALVGSSIGELHRDPEAIAIFWADLSQQLEHLDARSSRQQLGRVEEVTLSSRAFSMDERERNGMPDALRVDPPRLLQRFEERIRLSWWSEADVGSAAPQPALSAQPSSFVAVRSERRKNRARG
jgi:hypothetical protein